MFIPDSFSKITAIKNENISKGNAELLDDGSDLKILPSDEVIILSKALSTIFFRSGSVPNCSNENPRSFRYFPASVRKGYFTISSFPRLTITIVYQLSLKIAIIKLLFSLDL